MTKKICNTVAAAAICIMLAAVYTIPGQNAFAADNDAADAGSLDGMTLQQVEADENLSPLLEDPLFEKYYTVGDDGVIRAAGNDEEVEYAFTAEGEDMLTTASGVTKIGGATVPSKYKSKTRYNCIDISYWNCYKDAITAADWKKIKNAGITHVIVRVGYSTLAAGSHGKDSYFASSINKAYSAGLKVGAYYYSTATTAAEAKAEAKYTVKLLKNYKSKITLPVVYDYETGGRLTAKVMKSKGTASCKAFCNYIKSAGYTPMVYANYSTFVNYIDYKTLEDAYPIWLAHYTSGGKATGYPGEYCMWQYSSSCKVSGISGSVDINYVFNGVQGDMSGNSGSSSGNSSSSDADNTVTTYKGTTTCSMNYRTGPGTNYKVKGTYSKGKTIYMVSRTGSWAKMKNGYYISLSGVRYNATVTADSVNYRTGPGTKYKVKGTYSKGKNITIVKVSGSWAKMSNSYWIYVKYTKMR